MYATRYISPEAVGYLVAEYVRCGKPNCRCRLGRKHGPYWHLRFRRLEDGIWRRRKLYVPARDVPAVQRWLEQNKARDRAATALLKDGRRLRSALAQRRLGKINQTQLENICNELTGANTSQE